MKTVGIISEYNPFHNGHQYQIAETKKALQADCVVAMMSGNFTQRGEITAFDMYSRAEIACRNGVDLVLEIPPQFVLNSAEFYAFYGVYLLHSLHCIDYLSFGSECGDLQILSELTQNNSDEIKERLKSGITYAKAVSDSPMAKEPNNILGIEYLKALKKLNSDIQPFTVPRKAVSHNATLPDGKYASASFLRNAIQSGESVTDFLPELPQTSIVSENVLIPLFNYRLASGTAHDFSSINNISEGLQNRFIQARGKQTVQEIINAVKCKRYPETRLRRALYSILLDIEKSDELPCYTRVLAFTDVGQKLLRTIRKNATISVYSRITKKDILLNHQLQKELFCNEIFSLAQKMNERG